jgi:hypothetical protein
MSNKLYINLKIYQDLIRELLKGATAGICVYGADKAETGRTKKMKVERIWVNGWLISSGMRVCVI